jgi:hypothetical protein
MQLNPTIVGYVRIKTLLLSYHILAECTRFSSMENMIHPEIVVNYGLTKKQQLYNNRLQTTLGHKTCKYIGTDPPSQKNVFLIIIHKVS